MEAKNEPRYLLLMATTNKFIYFIFVLVRLFFVFRWGGGGGGGGGGFRLWCPKLILVFIFKNNI